MNEVRADISIMLHHDAITGTSSPSAEEDWLETISDAGQKLQQLRYEVVEKLGRL